MDVARQSQCFPLLLHVVPPHATLSSSNHDFHRDTSSDTGHRKKKERALPVKQQTTNVDRRPDAKSREIYLNVIVATMQCTLPMRFLFFCFDPSFLIFRLPAFLSRKRRCNHTHAFHTCAF